MSNDVPSYAVPPAPVSVRVVGWGLILAGALWMSDLLWVIARRDVRFLGVESAFPFVFLPLGIGILCGFSRARRWSIYVCAFFTVLMAIAIGLMAIAVAGFWTNHIGVPATLRDWLAVFGLPMLCALSWRALTRPTAIAWFDANKAKSPRRGRFQFRISTALLAILILAIVVARVPLNEFTYEPYQGVRETHGVGDGQVTVTYGHRQHRRDGHRNILAFVIFEHLFRPEDRYSGIITSGSPPGEMNVTYFQHDGRVHRMSSTHQLHEIKDGELRTVEGTVTKEQLDSYLNSKPARPSIDDLLKWRVDAE